MTRDEAKLELALGKGDIAFIDKQVDQLLEKVRKLNAEIAFLERNRVDANRRIEAAEAVLGAQGGTAP